jgi:hypothetical protein
MSIFQEDDFIFDDKGREVGYRGPLFRVRYPRGVDPVQEMHDWHCNGYRVQIGFGYGEGDQDTLIVMGDIPAQARERFRQVGVEVSLEKPRGVVSDIHPSPCDG